MIWHQASTQGIHSALLVRGIACPFCQGCTKNVGPVPRNLGLKITELDRGDVFADVCPACGWWCIEGTIGGTFGADDPLTPNEYSQREVMAAAALLNLDVTDDTAALDDVRRYLLARAESGATLHPRLFEETVASVFRNIGFEARVTSYSGDGGIDVILDGADGRTVGVQVKRYRERIRVEHIRSFIGALLIEGHYGGIFVTTSDFQRGSYVAAEKASALGLPVSLVTGDRFREALRIVNALTFRPYALDEPPFTTAPLATVCYRGEWCSGPYTNVWQSDADDMNDLH